MRLLVSGATKTLARYADRYGEWLGHLPVPGARNRPGAIASTGLPVALDNGGFKGVDFPRWRAMLAAYAGRPVWWAAVPDVICDGAATLANWSSFSPEVRALAIPAALVLQNGMTLADVKAAAPDAVFVGGDTEFKLGRAAREMVEWARSEGLPAHMGRVNSRRRVRYAGEIGCTSFDGSGFSKWPDTWIPSGCRWARGAVAPRTPSLF